MQAQSAIRKNHYGSAAALNLESQSMQLSISSRNSVSTARAFFQLGMLTFILVICTLSNASGATSDDAVSDDDSTWFDHTSAQLKLHFFWTSTCPHCQTARPFIAELSERHDWLQVVSAQLDDDSGNARVYIALAERLGENAYSVPAFIFCGRMITGFSSAQETGQLLEQQLLECRSDLSKGIQPWQQATGPSSADSITTLPLLGARDLRSWSLPLVTIVLAALDSFNPCAFFVLLFLLSLLVNARSRSRMMLVGGIFVLVSGVVYLGFMAAWLNLFLLFGELSWLTLAAGLLAVSFGLINLKDYFFSGTGPSLSIPASAKPDLFARMRALISADSLPTMIAGTLMLAVFANSYELLCTAGFPMIFTRLLTLNELSTPVYYGYLVLYCTVYIVPLLIIVGLFTRTLGKRKLSAREGRILKLMSGAMMTGLGAILLIEPLLISNLAVTATLIAGALAFTWLIDHLTPDAPG
jgi:thiol-disulfide isomerase/thioredoxin